MRDIAMMHGSEFARWLRDQKVPEGEARQLVLEECPDWTEERTNKYFGAAGLYGYLRDGSCAASA